MIEYSAMTPDQARVGGRELEHGATANASAGACSRAIPIIPGEISMPITRGCSGGQEASNVPRAAAHVGNSACGGQLDEGVLSMARSSGLPSQLVTELIVVSAGDRIVGRLHPNGHASLTGETVRPMRLGMR